MIDMSLPLYMQLEFLGFDYACAYDEATRYLGIKGLPLPEGFYPRSTPLLIKWNEHYPFTTPGYGSSRIYVDNALRFESHPIPDVHINALSIYGRRWAWFTPQHLDWSPADSDLVSLVSAIHTNLRAIAIR